VCTANLIGPPGKPMNVRFSDNDTTGVSFVVLWNEVIDEFFEVNYNVTWSGEDGVSGIDTTSATLLTVTGLNNNTVYNVTVTAITTCCGAGPVSDIMTVMTNMRSPTLPPITVTPTPTNRTGMVLE